MKNSSDKWCVKDGLKKRRECRCRDMRNEVYSNRVGEKCQDLQCENREQGICERDILEILRSTWSSFVYSH